MAQKALLLMLRKVYMERFLLTPIGLGMLYSYEQLLPPLPEAIS